MEKNKYNTKHTNTILNYLKENNENPITADKLIVSLKLRNINIGTATVYRILEKLTRENIIKKFITEDSKSALYQYTMSYENCDSHFHFKCKLCDKILHVDCSELTGLMEHTSNHHSFYIDLSKTIFHGHCKDCKEE